MHMLLGVIHPPVGGMKGLGLYDENYKEETYPAKLEKMLLSMMAPFDEAELVDVYTSKEEHIKNERNYINLSLKGLKNRYVRDGVSHALAQDIARKEALLNDGDEALYQRAIDEWKDVWSYDDDSIDEVIYEDGSTKHYGSPKNATWDWWRVGGRWDNILPGSSQKISEIKFDELWEDGKFTTFALLVEGRWVDKDNLDDEVDYEKYFYDMMTKHADSMLTLIDYHS